MDQEVLKRYEPLIGRLSRFYHSLYVRGRQDFDLDIGDFEQAGRMAVWNISQKRPEKAYIVPYVKVAVKHAIFREMGKMKHKIKQVYLASGFEEQVSLVDVLPTKEKGVKVDELEDILYRIKHEFSDKDAEGLESLLDKCENIYDLNLSEPPSTETKDRIKVVTRMDLNDEEMVVYAEVLLGVRGRFPQGFTLGDDGRKRAKKYAAKFLEALGISPKDFLQRNDKLNLIRRYRLDSFYRHVYEWSMLDFMKDFDGSLTSEDMVLSAYTPLSELEIEKIVNAYEEYGGKASKASKALGHDLVTITKYWRQQGFKIKKQGNISLTPRQIQEILVSHSKYQGNALEAERNLEYSDSTIAKYWRLAGLEVLGKSTALPEEEVDKIVSSFERSQGIPNRAAQALGYDPITIKKYWEAHGLEPKGKKKRKKIITPDQVSEIVSSFDKFQGVHCRAAQALGYDPVTIKRYWIKAGLMK